MAPRSYSSAPSAVMDAPESGAAVESTPARAWRSSSVAGAPIRRSTATAVVRRRFSESAADYAYVRKDLLTIGMLAAGLLVGLIVLSFFIR